MIDAVDLANFLTDEEISILTVKIGRPKSLDDYLNQPMKLKRLTEINQRIFDIRNGKKQREISSMKYSESLMDINERLYKGCRRWWKRLITL